MKKRTLSISVLAVIGMLVLSVGADLSLPGASRKLYVGSLNSIDGSPIGQKLSVNEISKIVSSNITPTTR